MFVEEYPAYYYSSEDYSYCKNIEEVKIERLVRAFIGCVNQRYVDYGPKTSTAMMGMKYCSFRPDESGKSLRDINHGMFKRYQELVKRIPDAKDPGDFIGYVFEMWKNREYYARYTSKPELIRPGIAFPSMNFILNNGKTLVPRWLAIPDYKPRHFLVPSKVDTFDNEVIEGVVNRWCARQGKTTEEYWLDPRNLITVDHRYIDASTSLKESEEAIKAKFGFDIEELRAYLIEEEKHRMLVMDALYERKLKSWGVK